MKIKRDNQIYEVIDEVDTSYCVEVPFQFADNTTKLLKLWWDKRYCEIIEDETLPNL